MKNSEISLLIEKVKSRKPGAFEELYSQLWKTIYFLAYNYLKNEEDAKDVLQEVFLIVYKNIHHIRNNEAFNSWIKKVTYSVCTKQIEKNNKLSATQEINNQIAEKQTEFLPEKQYLETELSNDIYQLVSELPNEQKSAVLLYYYDRTSVLEIAKILETTDLAIYKKLSRARETLRIKLKQLEGKGYNLYSFSGFSVLMMSALGKKADLICQPAIKLECWNTIKLSIAGSIGVTKTAVIGKKAFGSVISKVSIALTTTAVIASSAFATIHFFPKQVEQPRQTPEMNVSKIPESINNNIEESINVTIPEPEPQALSGLEGLIGVEDTNLVKSWRERSSKNKNEEIKDFSTRHELTFLYGFFDINEDKNMYNLYVLEKNNAQLIICEQYNGLKNEWSARYSLEDSPIILPKDSEIKQFYLTH